MPHNDEVSQRILKLRQEAAVLPPGYHKQMAGKSAEERLVLYEQLELVYRRLLSDLFAAIEAAPPGIEHMALDRKFEELCQHRESAIPREVMEERQRLNKLARDLSERYSRLFTKLQERGVS